MFKILTAISIIFFIDGLCQNLHRKLCDDDQGECVSYERCSNLTQYSDGVEIIDIRFQECDPFNICCVLQDVLDEKKDDMIIEASRDSSVCDSDLNECVHYYFCLNQTFTDGSNIINPRFGDDACTEPFLDTCCDKRNILKPFVPNHCGLRNEPSLNFIPKESPNDAEFGEFPWMMALSEINKSIQVFFCGGSLIHPSVVLTGAHCVNEKNVEQLRVRVGEFNTQYATDSLFHSDHSVNQIIIRPDFGVKNLFNDVALLELKSAVKLSFYVNTVCLPTQNYKPIQSECFSSGWGAEQFKQKADYKLKLKKVQLPVVPRKECEDSLRTTKLGRRFKLNSSFMCAGGEKDVDTCTGDGGSPLVCPVDDMNEIYYQAGIVAWGIGCGQQGIPGVYANVAKFRDWIDQHMNDLGYGTQSYTIKYE